MTVVVHQEKDSLDALSQTLKESGARGLLFSPDAEVDDKKNTRDTYLKKLLPELNKLYPGDPLTLSNYPHLKSLIQLGHTSIRGIIKYKDAMVYANPKLTTLEIPENSSSDTVFESYQGGKQVSSYTNSDIVNFAE